MNEKYCKSCGETKPLLNFKRRDNQNKLRHMPTCNDCELYELILVEIRLGKKEVAKIIKPKIELPKQIIYRSFP